MASSDKTKKADTAPAKHPAANAVSKSGAANAPAKAKKPGTREKPCTSFFVKVAVLTPDDQHEIHFGVSKTCNKDNTATWSLHFTLKELKNGKTRVEIEAQVGPENAAAMEKLAASKKLTEEQKDTLQGPVADMVKELPPGSKGTAETRAAIVEAVTS
jgi:hypothetical protein